MTVCKFGVLILPTYLLSVNDCEGQSFPEINRHLQNTISVINFRDYSGLEKTKK